MRENISSFLINILSIFFCLIPLLMISGPFLPDLFLIIIVLSIFYLIYLEKDFSLFNKKYFTYFILFNLILITISLFSQNLTSIKSSVFYLRFGLFVMATFYLLLLNEKIFKYLLYVFLIIYFALFVDSIYQFYNLENIFGFKYLDEGNFRITSFFGKDEILGSYTARFFPLLIFLIILNHNPNKIKKQNIFIIILTLMSFCLVMLVGENFNCIIFNSFIFSHIFIYKY